MFGTKLFQIADCVSVPTFCHFNDHLRLLLENSPFKNLWRINCLDWNFVQCGRIHFALTKIKNKLVTTKNRVFISLDGPSETGKSQLLSNWLKIGTFQSKFDKIYSFCGHSQPLYDVMQKEIENLEFVLGVNFEFTDSLKNNGTKYLLILPIHVKKFAIQRPLLTLPRLGDNGVWAQSTLNIFFFTRAN